MNRSLQKTKMARLVKKKKKKEKEITLMDMHFSSSASIFATRTVTNNYFHDKSINY